MRKSDSRDCRCAVLATAGLLLTLVGCQFVPDYQPLKLNPFARDQADAVPDRMMVIWSDTVLHQPQKPGIRGFGGRVYFYRGDEPKPVTVDGGLVVYAFDGDDVSYDATRPEKKYVFTADQFSEHMSHTDMGPSYSVWLPWDEIGGPNRRLSLIARFEGRSGGVVISKPMTKLLPGVGKYIQPRDDQGRPEAEPLPGTGVRQASGHSTSTTLPENERPALAGHLEDPGSPQDPGAVRAGAATGPRRAGLRREPSMTIDLPPNFQRHLKGRAPSSSAPLRSASSPPSRTDLDRSQSTAEEESKEPAEELGGAEGNHEAATSRRGYSGAPPRRRHTFRQMGTPDEIPEGSAGILNRPAGWLTPPEKTARPYQNPQADHTDGAIPIASPSGAGDALY